MTANLSACNLHVTSRMYTPVFILLVKVLRMLRLSCPDVLNYFSLDLDADTSFYIGCAITDIRSGTADDYHDTCLTTTETHDISVSSCGTTHEGSETTRDLTTTATAVLDSQRSSSSSSSGGSLPISVIGILQNKISSA